MAKEKKETTSEYFIQLGMKINGKIVANQQHELNKFMNHIVEDSVIETEVNISLWDRIFHYKKQKKELKLSSEKFGIGIIVGMNKYFKELILQDLQQTRVKKAFKSTKAVPKKKPVKKPVKRGKK